MHSKDILICAQGLVVGTVLVFLVTWCAGTLNPALPWDTAFAQAGEIAIMAFIWSAPILYALSKVITWLLVKKLTKSLDTLDHA